MYHYFSPYSYGCCANITVFPHIIMKRHNDDSDLYNMDKINDTAIDDHIISNIKEEKHYNLIIMI